MSPLDGINERGGDRAPDVFLSYHSADRQRVTAIKDRLSQQGIQAFLDRDDLVAGLPWPQALERVLQSVRAVLVFVGNIDGGESLGLWQRREVWFALDHQAHREGEGQSFPVVPVLLPGARPDTGFLFLNTWADFREPANEAAAIDAIVKAMRQGDGRAPEAIPITICPYRALEAFQEEHAALFFGRESFANDLVQRVVQRRLVALVGPSGSGKSSVIQAGLVPLLRRQRPPEKAWDVVVFRPGDQPFHRLAACLAPLLEPEADEIDRLELARKLGDKLANGGIHIEDVIERLLAKSNGTDRLVVIADQFEELFTLTPAQRRRPFMQAVQDALDRAPLSVVLALRADFYGHAIALDRRLSDHIQSGIVNLAPMTRAELRRAVEQPAHRAAITFEAGLVDRILNHLELQPGGLPLLEFALTQLWERRDGRRLTHAAYDAIGEIPGAISKRAETVYLTLDHCQRHGALSLFTRLVRVAASRDTEPDTRCRVSVDALNDSEHSALQRFVDARLLVLNRGNSAEEHTVELAHEALIQGWNRLVEWVDQQREFLLWRQRLGQAVGEWQRTGRNTSALLRGPALKEAVSWAHRRNADLNQAENEFVRRSRKRIRQRRGWLGVASVLTILVVGAVPVLLFLSQTNPAVVWMSTRVAAPDMLLDASPSAIANWIHTLDVAGRLDEVGAETLGFPEPRTRLSALEVAARLMVYQGRMADANRLVDRVLAITKELPNFDSNPEGQLSASELLARVGRQEAAGPMALRARALQPPGESPEIRAERAADIAWVLAQAGLKREATDALNDARVFFAGAQTPGERVVQTPQDRLVLGGMIARALVQLGAVEEAMALVSDLPEWTPPPSFVQLLVDRGYYQQASDLVAKSDNFLVPAVLASSLVSENRAAEAKAVTLVALARLEKAPMADRPRDTARAAFYEGLLLEVMTPSEAVGWLRDRGDADQLASLAVVLARRHLTDLSVDAAHEAAGRAGSRSEGQDQARILVKVTEALATSGLTDRALSTARAIKEQDLQTAALAHVAYGFVAEEKKRGAEGLLRDIAKRLPSIRDPDVQSAVWATAAIARIRLGDYAAVNHREGPALNFRESEGIDPYDADVLRALTWLVRDDAERRNEHLRDAFARATTNGLGRYGLHWP